MLYLIKLSCKGTAIKGTPKTASCLFPLLQSHICSVPILNVSILHKYTVYLNFVINFISSNLLLQCFIFKLLFCRRLQVVSHSVRTLADMLGCFCKASVQQRLRAVCTSVSCELQDFAPMLLPPLSFRGESLWNDPEDGTLEQTETQ